jgi:hypothetical protein
MPVIAFSSPKGGCGKTTGAVVLATVLAERGASVAVIDADPKKNVVDWARLPGKPASLTVTGEVDEESIVDAIEAAAGRAAFVVVDLEGAANLLVSYAISLADFVVIPMQGSSAAKLIAYAAIVRSFFGSSRLADDATIIRFISGPSAHQRGRCDRRRRPHSAAAVDGFRACRRASPVPRSRSATRA